MVKGTARRVGIPLFFKTYISAYNINDVISASNFLYYII